MLDWIRILEIAKYATRCLMKAREDLFPCARDSIVTRKSERARMLIRGSQKNCPKNSMIHEQKRSSANNTETTLGDFPGVGLIQKKNDGDESCSKIANNGD